MTFRNLFLVLVPGSDPAARVVHADDLSHTTIVPVPSVAAAVSVLSSFGPVDLIELYGGLGIDAAAALLDVGSSAAIGFAGDVQLESKAAVLFLDPNADPAIHRWTFGETTVVAIPSDSDAPAIAAALVEAGARRVELCGAMGPVPAAAVRAAVDVPVTPVLFGFESLPAIAAYRAGFEKAIAAYS